MEYLTPLIYRKILNTISYIYYHSARDPDWDLFRFKDVLDSFNEAQFTNKTWAVEELNKFITDEYEECYIIGGWHGLFSHILAESGFNKRIINIELDPVCNIIAKQLKIHENIRFKDDDGIDLFPKFNHGNKIVVCTACEHIDNEELEFIIRQKEPGMLMCLQSNNYYEVTSHINCKDTLEDFVESLPLKQILYAGERRNKNKYDRFMVIGK
jgi:hypothetical protein